MEDALKMLAVKMRGSWMNINGGIKQLLNKKTDTGTNMDEEKTSAPLGWEDGFQPFSCEQ